MVTESWLTERAVTFIGLDGGLSPVAAAVGVTSWVWAWTVRVRVAMSAAAMSSVTSASRAFRVAGRWVVMTHLRGAWGGIGPPALWSQLLGPVFPVPRDSPCSRFRSGLPASRTGPLCGLLMFQRVLWEHHIGSFPAAVVCYMCVLHRRGPGWQGRRAALGEGCRAWAECATGTRAAGGAVAAGCQDPVACGTISAVAAPSCFLVCRRIVNDWDSPARL